ncbi:hypothetical protein GCM10027577_27520 [Spirosoma fluminis]
MDGFIGIVSGGRRWSGGTDGQKAARPNAQDEGSQRKKAHNEIPDSQQYRMVKDTQSESNSGRVTK